MHPTSIRLQASAFQDGDDTFNDLTAAVALFIDARSAPPNSRLPSDFTADPVRASNALAIVRAGIDQNDPWLQARNCTAFDLQRMLSSVHVRSIMRRDA